MEAESGGEPRVVRDRFAYIDDVHAFILSRVEDALAEWSDRTRVAGGPMKDRSRGARHRPARKASRNTPRERLG